MEFLATQVKVKIDILMILETKIDKSIERIERFSTPSGLDLDSKSGEIMLYGREDIPSNLIAFEDKPIKNLFIELNLQNTKILINCSCNPHKSEIKKYLTALRNYLDLRSSKYEKILILCNLNVEEEANMKSFCENYNLESLIKQPTFYNIPHMFQSTCVMETEMSHFHLMIVAVMRKNFKKIHPRVINYRFYRDFF